MTNANLQPMISKGFPTVEFQRHRAYRCNHEDEAWWEIEMPTGGIMPVASPVIVKALDKNPDAAKALILMMTVAVRNAEKSRKPTT